MHSASETARLLPWESPEGKPCYVLGDGAGHVTRLADDVERVQLAMAADLLGYADDMLDDRRITVDQLRYVAERLAEALRAVCRIARSRGDRIPAPDDVPLDAESRG